jgi:serine/threonine protein kinase
MSTEVKRPELKEIGEEPLPGYRLLEPLGAGGFGEVWKCEVPGGLHKAIKFVKGASTPDGQNNATRDSAALEFQAIQRVKTVRHPFLLSIERVEILGGEMVLVMELADRSLAERFAECQAAGQPGIGRDELLAYMMEAAEVLDVMNIKHGLQHLDIKPANLFIVGNHLKVADFGLVNSLEELQTDGPPNQLDGLTPLYVAPETLLGKTSRHSDQYSLAIVYQELLTGTFPFSGDRPRKLMMAHLMGEPDLSGLPEVDRPLVARALAKDPHRRFPSCLHFIQALVFGADQSPDDGPAATNRPPVRFPPTPPSAPVEPPQPTTVVKRLKPVAVSGNIGETVNSAAHAPRSDTKREPPKATSASQTLPGYHVLERVGRDPFGEVYMARDADGRERQIRFLSSEGGGADTDPRLLARLTALRHPALPRLEAKTISNGRVVLISDAVERSLLDRFDECVTSGMTGIPRVELLRHLEKAAVALDAIQRRELLQHLGLSPRALLLHDGRVRFGDFGLTQLIWLPRWEQIPHLNRRYAAPELLNGCLNSTCDVYSLALIFVEMLTGVHPFRNRLRSQVTASRAAKPDLDWLPAPDRAGIARALDPDPRERFRTCSELIAALMGTAAGAVSFQTPSLDELPFIQPLANLFGGNEALAQTPSINRIVTQVVLTESSAVTIGVAQQLPYLQRRDLVLETRFPIRQLPGMIRLKMDAFCEKWEARLMSQTDQSFVLRLQETGTFWQRCFGQKSGLEVRLDLRSPAAGRSHTSEVTATVRPFGGVQHQAAQKLPEVGPMLLVSLRDDLQNTPDQRGQVRWPCSPDLDVYLLQSDGTVSAVLAAKGQDISLTGIAFWTAERPPSQYAYLHLKTFTELAPLVLLVRIVRVAPCDGGFKTGASFVTDGVEVADSVYG